MNVQGMIKSRIEATKKEIEYGKNRMKDSLNEIESCAMSVANAKSELKELEAALEKLK